jgi:hypothetical protein
MIPEIYRTTNRLGDRYKGVIEDFLNWKEHNTCECCNKTNDELLAMYKEVVDEQSYEFLDRMCSDDYTLSDSQKVQIQNNKIEEFEFWYNQNYSDLTLTELEVMNEIDNLLERIMDLQDVDPQIEIISRFIDILSVGNKFDEPVRSKF